MKDDERERLLIELIERPGDRESILRDAQISDREREELVGTLDTADSLWLSAQEAPTLSHDPVAAMLGLVPDRECSLDSEALAGARKRAGMKVSDVAARLQQRGWDFEKSDVFRWETRTARDVPPAVVQTLAEILGTPADTLISPSADGTDNLADVRSHPRFAQLAARWARVCQVSLSVATATLESRMLATVHRGEHPDAEQLLDSLDVLVSSIERPTMSE